MSGRPSINETRIGTGDTVFIDEEITSLHLGKGDALLEACLIYLDQSEAIKLCIANR